MEKIRIARHAGAGDMPNWKAKDKLSQKNGAHSTIYLINGDRYMGDWKDNKRHGKGTHYYKKSGNQYMGEWQNDKRHGYGTLSVPESLWADAPANQSNISFFAVPETAQSTISNADSLRLRKIYTGTWENDKKHGNGTHYFQDGSVYEGSWFNDMRQGWGRQSYADGSVYEGEWHHEMRHGQGVLLLANGDRYEGMWFDDEKEGPGKFIYLAKRQCYKGEWSRGQPRCGTIINLSSMPGYPGTLYDMPPLGLENPQQILDEQQQLICEERAARLVGLSI